MSVLFSFLCFQLEVFNQVFVGCLVRSIGISLLHMLGCLQWISLDPNWVRFILGWWHDCCLYWRCRPWIPFISKPFSIFKSHAGLWLYCLISSGSAIFWGSLKLMPWEGAWTSNPLLHQWYLWQQMGRWDIDRRSSRFCSNWHLTNCKQTPLKN